MARLYAGSVTEAAWWEHARRPRWDLYLSTGKASVSIAAEALRRIAALYAVERDIRGQPPCCPAPSARRRRAHIRGERRQARAGPLLAELHAWLASLVGLVSANSEIAKAIGYSVTRWRALTHYCDDGRLEIDNNAAERALHGVALGRGNLPSWARAPAASAPPAIYSLLETVKLNGLDPEWYLPEVLGRSADHPINRIDELLPSNTGRRIDERRQPDSAREAA